MDKRKEFDFDLLENEVLILAYKLLEPSEIVEWYYNDEELLSLITTKNFEEKFNAEFENMDARIELVNSRKNDDEMREWVENKCRLKVKDDAKSGTFFKIISKVTQRQELGSALGEIERLRIDYFSTLQYLIDTSLSNFRAGKEVVFECINNATQEKGYLTCVKGVLMYEHPNHDLQLLYSTYEKAKFDKIFEKTQVGSNLNNDDDWDK